MSEPNDRSPSEPKLRVWIPVVLVVLQFALMYGFARFGSTLVQNAIGMTGVPAIVLLGVGLWWMLAKAVPLRERLAGVGVYLVVQGLIVLTHPRYGHFMLAYSIPVTTAALVVALALGAHFSVTARRVAALAVAVLCVAGFGTLRIDTVGGGLNPIVAPRWTPTAADRAEAIGLLPDNKTATLPDTLGPHDWPGFRGAHRDNVVRGVRFSTDWSTPPNVRWRTTVGPGLSSIAVAGDCAFTQEQRGENEVVSCYDLRTGELIWTNVVPARFEDSMGVGPRATPAYYRGKLFAMGATGVFQCIDAATGETRWKHHLGGEEGAHLPQYGFASSPLVVDDAVVVYNCGAGRKQLVAFDVARGGELWSTAEGTRAYSSPHFAKLGDEPQILLLNDTGLQSFLPQTGALLWAHAWPMSRYPRCVQPLFLSEETIALGSTGSTGTRLVRVSKEADGWKTSALWTTRKLRPYFNDCVAHNGFIYGYDGNRLVCLDGETGERRWQGERYGGQVMLVREMELLLVLSEDGEVILLRASPEAPEEVARCTAISGKTWNHPVVAHGVLLVRNAQEAACIELPGLTIAP